jgi:hypothetical protein
LNNGESWEPWLQTGKGAITCIRTHPLIKGLLAAATIYKTENNKARSRVFVSRDCGENWDLLQETSRVRDIAWLPLVGEPTIFIATDDGLFRGPLLPGTPDLTVPVKIKTEKFPADQTVYAVASFVDAEGEANIAVAMSRNRGIYLSKQGGKQNSFESIGPDGLNITLLLVQQEGTQIWLWAGTGTSAGQGQGCWRRDLRAGVNPAEEWKEFSTNWVGGACYGLALSGDKLLAATGDRGVLQLDLSGPAPAWVVDREFYSGLPKKSAEELYHPVWALGSQPGPSALVLAGGPKGVFRSSDHGLRYRSCCRREFRERVSLPKTWLIRSGEHDLSLVYDHEKE